MGPFSARLSSGFILFTSLAAEQNGLRKTECPACLLGNERG